jgi:nicotinamidase-related amidase
VPSLFGNPYPWPYDGQIDGSRLALVVAGGQEHFVSSSCGSARVAVAISELAYAVATVGGWLVVLRHGRPLSTRPGLSSSPGEARPPVPVVGSEGWQPAGLPGPADLVVECRGFDGCYGSLLEHELRAAGRDRVLLAGYASEVTVDSTVRTLNDRGFECLVVTDACAPLNPHTGAHAFSSLTMSGGIFGALASTAEVVDLLTKLSPLVPEET